MKLLVAGADRVDAGKTTFTLGLLDYLDAPGFKPRAGNNYWFHHDDYRHAVEQGRLFGGDARKLAAASPGDVDPEDINPIHRLWRPSLGSGTGILGKDDQEFVVDRVGETYVVNDTVDVPRFAREHLPLSDAPRVASLPAFNDLMERLHVPVLEGIQRHIADHEPVVVESYGDVARPISGFDPDAVAVVEPGRVRVYDGHRYAKACQVATGGPGDGQLEERVPRVVELIDAAVSVGLPALGSDERTDPGAIAAVNEAAYDELLAVARA
jgi:predicted P-loop ATPase/GTPase